MKWEIGSRNVEWSNEGDHIVKVFAHPVQRAIMLADNSGVAVVEGLEASAPNNAVIFNLDGSERVRIKEKGIPFQGIGFYNIYYLGNDLTLSYACSGVDYAVVINSNNGDTISYQ